jgi:hypothetical protein
MAFKIEDDKIIIKKDCKKCVHLKVCKFHAKTEELFKSNEFYNMTKYLEWNDNLSVFELHSSCQFFTLTFKIPEDKSLNLDIDEDIIKHIVSKNLPEGTRSWRVDLETKLGYFDTKENGKLEINLQEILDKSGIKFG